MTRCRRTPRLRSVAPGLLFLLASALWCGRTAAAADLTLGKPEAAGICGYRAMWDTPVVLAEEGVRRLKDRVVKDRSPTAPWAPGLREKGAKPAALSFDALHRSLLVRFPGSAEQIAAQVAKGYRIEKAELVLPFKDTELWPEGDPNFPPAEGGYHYRSNWGVDRLYRKVPPQWHAVAWALRKPWEAGPKLGPTYNAHIGGAAYWARFGAQHPIHDRFPERFGPAEVSQKSPMGRLDVTAALTHPRFGHTLGQRLRRLADCGFLIRKWELYDHRYYTGCYEWATATGGRAILIGKPRLVVRLVADPKAPRVESLPPPADIPKLAARLKGTREGGRPTAVLPSAEQIQDLADHFRPHRPRWMPEWQWRRVRELAELGDGRARLSVDDPFWYQYVPAFIRSRMKGRGQLDAVHTYQRWVDVVLGRQPRGWHGFSAARVLLPWFLYPDAMPEPMKDHWKLYWTAWLMPDRPTADSARKRVDRNYAEGPLVHPMADDPRVGGPEARSPRPDQGRFDTYYARTGDWRGNKSFYRSGFCYTMSTMNFNHTASMGALLGGAIIGSERAMADGRHGWEHWPLRTWSWLDGTTQESIDHYYFAITLSAQKMVADFGPTFYDRLMGRIILAKSVDELATAYHPGLRRFIAGSARTAMNHLLATQDGCYHIVHTLSKRGVLHGLGDTPPGRMPVIGREVRPLRVAQQTLHGPWAPEWMAATVDAKKLPLQMTCAFTQWGGHKAHPIWRRTFLGNHYGLYSCDLGWGFIPNMAQWRRADKPVEHMAERATMILRYGVNDTQLVSMGPGWIRHFGVEAALQHRNILLAVTSPYAKALKRRKGIRSLQATLALYNYQQPKPTWRIFLDGSPVEKLPATAKAGQRITIHDSVAYVGIIPLPAADLGRDAEVVLAEGDVQTFGRVAYKPALVVNNHNLRRDKPLDAAADWDAINKAYGGFIVELGDATEHPDFAAYQKHILAARLTTRWEASKSTLHVRYESGRNVLECGVITTYQDRRPSPQLFAYRRVNGKWPYLPPGIFRDSPTSIQGTTGRLEKGGAVLATKPGQMAFLQAEPTTGTYAACNPFSDPTPFELTVPGGMRITGDGKVGIARITVRPKENKLWADCAFRPDQAGPGLATALYVAGPPKPPAVVLNGVPLTKPLDRLETRYPVTWVVRLPRAAQ